MNNKECLLGTSVDDLRKTELKSNIICCVDTGSCEDVIVRDVLKYYPGYEEQDIRDCIHLMLKKGELIDRGAYLVYNYEKQ